MADSRIMATQRALIEALMVTATVYTPVVARVHCWRFSVSDFLISYFWFPNFLFLLLVTPFVLPVTTPSTSATVDHMNLVSSTTISTVEDKKSILLQTAQAMAGNESN